MRLILLKNPLTRAALSTSGRAETKFLSVYQACRQENGACQDAPGDLRRAPAQPVRPADSASQLTAFAAGHTLAPGMERTRSQFNVFGANIR